MNQKSANFVVKSLFFIISLARVIRIIKRRQRHGCGWYFGTPQLFFQHIHSIVELFHSLKKLVHFLLTLLISFLFRHIYVHVVI